LQLLVELIMVLRASIVAAVFAFGVTGAAFAQPAPAWGNPSPVVEVDGLKLAYAKNKHRHYGWSRGRHYARAALRAGGTIGGIAAIPGPTV
jgi:hypothetical protein